MLKRKLLLLKCLLLFLKSLRERFAVAEFYGTSQAAVRHAVW